VLNAGQAGARTESSEKGAISKALRTDHDLIRTQTHLQVNRDKSA
jgi:hypothetical protein